MKKHILILSFILAFIPRTCLAQEVNPCDTDISFKIARQLIPKARWNRLKTGQRLETYDAIVTCGSSTAVIRANLPFNNEIQWRQDGEKYIAEITKTLLLLRGGDGVPTWVRIVVEIVKITGDAFYSNDKDVIKKAHFNVIKPKRRPLEGDFVPPNVGANTNSIAG